MGNTSKKNLKYAKKIGMIMTEAVNKGPNFNISKRDLLKNIKNVVFQKTSKNIRFESDLE